MEVNNYKIIIPVSPDSINKVIRFGKTENDIVKLKKKWEKIAMIFLEQAIDDYKLPKKFVGRTAFFFKLFFETHRERDGDNYAAMCKGIIDACVQLKLLPDDNHNFVDDDGRRLRIDHDRPRVEVYIKEKNADGKFANLEKDYEQCKITDELGYVSSEQEGAISSVKTDS